MTPKVKICGITNLEDAKVAADAGADMLGFVFYKKSPRYIKPDKAKDIIDHLPDNIEKVALFVNESEKTVKDIVSRIGRLGILQFHGAESAAYCGKFDKKIIRAVRVKDKDSISGLSDYKVNFFLLDSFVNDAYGGTGKPFNWGMANEFRKKYNIPIILSGGLNCENVKEAIEKVKPYAVDVSSGVEESLGKKDAKLLREFIEKVKG